MKNLCLLFLLFLLITGCYRKPVKVVYNGNKDGKYDSEFPQTDVSGSLEAITHAVCRIFSVATYKTYYFKPGVEATMDDVTAGNYLNKSFGVTTSNETTSGTATLICHAFGKTVLITCAHVLENPDTLVSYYKPLKDEPERYISSISIRQKQESFIKELGTCGKVDVLAIDRENDVAIIGKTCEMTGEILTPFSFPAGNSRELRWGSFVYIIGYPMGSLMVTKGIVSIPKSDESGSFMVDALFNKGFSGGIILAIRDGIPNFELVGIIRSVPSQREYYLKPDKEANASAYDANAAYRGDLFVGTHELISYGVTTVVPVELIRTLYQKNRALLLTQGYDLDGFFKPQEERK